VNRLLCTTMMILAGGLSAEAAEPARIFRLQPAPGSAWALEATTSVGTSATVFGNEFDLGLHERLEATLVVERVDPDGSTVVLLHVDRLQAMKRTGDDDEDLVEYDSANPAMAASDDDEWREFRQRGESIVGRRWRFVLRPDGAIDGVSVDAAGADAETNPLLDHDMLVTSAEVIWLAFGGREVIRLPDGPVAVGATWLHEPAAVPAKAGDPAKPAAGGWFGTSKPKSEATFESCYAAREQVGERMAEVVTTRRLPPKRTFSLTRDPTFELDGRLLFDATTGEFAKGTWEGEFRSQAAVWWLLGKKIAMDFQFTLRVTPAPATKARQVQAVRPLPPVR